MYRFEWAKIPAAIIGALFLLLVARAFGFAFYPVEHMPTPVYQIEGVPAYADVDLASWQREWPVAPAGAREREKLAAFMRNMPDEIIGASTASRRQGPAADVEIPLSNLLASADLTDGEKQARKCLTCHNLEKDGSNDQGPALWGIIGAGRAKVAGFDYTAAMLEFGGEWTLESMYDYLVNPRKYIPGTNMSFAGIRKDQPRANLVAYLRTLSDDPVPLPAPADIPEATDMTEADAPQNASVPTAGAPRGLP